MFRFARVLARVFSIATASVYNSWYASVLVGPLQWLSSFVVELDVRDPKDITSSWLQKVLSGHYKDPNIKVKGIQLKPLKEEDNKGHSGGVLLLEVEYVDTDSKYPKSFFVKHQGGSFFMKLIGALEGIPKRETLIYNLKNLGVDVPKCYYSSYSEYSGNFLLLLENVIESGFTLRDNATQIPTTEENCLILSRLCDLHTVWTKDTLPKLDLPSLGETVPKLQGYLKGQCLPSFEKTALELKIPTEIIDMAPKFLEKMVVFGSFMLEKYPITLIHGDFRLDNFAFKKDSMMMFDWQFCYKGPDCIDLIRYISQNGGDNVVEFQNETVKIYCELKKLDLEKFKTEFALLVVYLYCDIIFMVSQMNSSFVSEKMKVLWTMFVKNNVKLMEINGTMKLFEKFDK
jgi:hypothetical protein